MPIRPYNAEQLFLLPPSLNEWVRADHPARVLSDIVSRLDVSGFRTVSREGRPCYDPRLMLKVLLWGYATGVRASRKLEERLHSDVVFMWLAGLQQPDFRTICLFRRSNLPALESMFAQVLLVAKGMGLLKLGLVALDGTKLRAATSIGSFKKVTEWRKELAEARKEVRRMLDDAEEQDQADDERYGSDRRGDELPAGLEDAKRRVEKIERLLKELGEGESENRLASVTDPQARYMHSQTGSIPAYNAQVAVTEDQIIVHADVTTEPIDTNQLMPALKGIKRAAGAKPEKLAADAGYKSGRNLRILERARVDGYLPDTEEKNIGKAKRNYPDLYGKEAFRYDKGRDSYTCPAGQELRPKAKLRRKTKYSGGVTKVYRPPRGVCQVCPQREGCTRVKGKVGRSVSRDAYEEERLRMRQKLATPEGKAIYGLRKCLAEPVIGQLKIVGGITRLLLRGALGARIEWKWAAIAHNLLKLSRRVTDGTAVLAAVA
jgi:transposase